MQFRDMFVGIETTLIFSTLIYLVGIELNSRVSAENLFRGSIWKNGYLWGFVS